MSVFNESAGYFGVFPSSRWRVRDSYPAPN
nr:MAG TPA: hypothetical protein [Caudoviricetes sp.]